VAKLRLNNRAPTGEPTALLFSSTAISR
jgi:hypothetical protein